MTTLKQNKTKQNKKGKGGPRDFGTLPLRKGITFILYKKDIGHVERCISIAKMKLGYCHIKMNTLINQPRF